MFYSYFYISFSNEGNRIPPHSSRAAATDSSAAAAGYIFSTTHLSLSLVDLLLCGMEASKEVQPEAGSGHGSSNRSSYLCRQSSTRWIPTAEQIRILKELYYNNGLRSPTAEQIQRISARLRQYGKIEGKNVFYWFQNHKARERQKKRLGADLAAQRTTASTSSVAVTDYLWSSYGDSPSNSTSIINTNVGTGQECRRSCGSLMTESGHLLDSSSLGRDGFLSPGSSCTSETGTDSHGIFDPGDLDGVADRCTGIVETLQLFPLRGGDGSGTGSERSRISETYPALCFGEGGSEPVSSLELTLSSFPGGDGGMRNPGSGHTFLPSGS